MPRASLEDCLKKIVPCVTTSIPFLASSSTSSYPFRYIVIAGVLSLGGTEVEALAIYNHPGNQWHNFMQMVLSHSLLYE